MATKNTSGLDALKRIQEGVKGLDNKFVSKNEYDAIKEKMVEMEMKLNRPGLGGGGTGVSLETESRKKMFAYVRTGEGRTPTGSKGASVDNAESLGYMAPPTYVAEVWERIRALSTIRDKATVITVGSSMAQIPVEDKFMDAYWEGEMQERQNSPNPSIKMANIPVNKVSARFEISNVLLEDSAFNIDAYITQRIIDAMAFKENRDLVVGDGVLKPRGFATYGDVVPKIMSGATSSNPFGGNFDSMVDAWAKLPIGYMPEAEWYMNLRTAARLRKLKDSQGRMLWQEPVMVGQPTTLLGYPVNFIDDLPEVEDDKIPIYFGNMRKAYCIVDRIGLGLDRTRDERMLYDQTVIYARRRLGGQLVLPEALVGIQIGA